MEDARAARLGDEEAQLLGRAVAEVGQEQDWERRGEDREDPEDLDVEAIGAEEFEESGVVAADRREQVEVFDGELGGGGVDHEPAASAREPERDEHDVGGGREGGLELAAQRADVPSRVLELV